MMRLAHCSYLLLLAAAAIFPVAAQSIRNPDPCGKVDSWSVGYNFGRKIKASAHSNEQVEVSQPILENLIHQLRIKVGNDFINNLHFSHVQGVDFDKRSELTLTDLKRIDAYEFTFEVRVGENGVFRYAFAIGTDKNGKFLSDVEIPDVAVSPDKGIIRPCIEAVNVARNIKVLTDTKSIFVRLRFDRAENVFVWDVYAYREGVGLHSDHVWLNANSLTVIKKFQEHEAF